MVRVGAVSRQLLGFLVLLLAVQATRTVAQRARGLEPVRDWMQFGVDPASSGTFPSDTGITAANAGSLTRRQVRLDGTVDASPIYLHDVTVNATTHDVFFVTTTYGKTIAIDADTATVFWEYTPPGYSSWA